VSETKHFMYVDGRLACDGADLERIAEELGTPTYVYSGAAIDEAYHAIDDALDWGPHLVAYAIKANSNLAVLGRIRELGAGADIVSGGELARCLEAGIPGSRIVFSGVGKRDEEIEAALDANVRSIHVESAQEIEAIEQIAKRRGTTAQISLRINPDVDPKTHPYIATGLHHTKFGLEIAVAERLLPRIVQSDHLVLEGVTCHIGSQIGEVSSLREGVAITARFAVRCREAGAQIRTLDAGGGWPITYGHETDAFPPPTAFGQAIREGIAEGGAADLDLEVIVEPGRALVGEAGVLLTRVVFVKDQPFRPDAVVGQTPGEGAKRFIIVDASMSELIRPALYEAHHAMLPLHAPEDVDPPVVHVDVVGPVCESGDWLARDRAMPPLARGDLIAIMGAGAYGMVMASNYNSRPRPVEVLVENGSHRVVRARETVADLMRGESRS
jgi:diaminopimelate decarboxylase